MSHPSVSSPPRTFVWARILTIIANCYGRYDMIIADDVV